MSPVLPGGGHGPGTASPQPALATGAFTRRALLGLLCWVRGRDRQRGRSSPASRASSGPEVRAHSRGGGRCLFLVGSGGAGAVLRAGKRDGVSPRSRPGMPARLGSADVPALCRCPGRGGRPGARSPLPPSGQNWRRTGVGGNAPLTVSSDLSVLQEVFGAEVCEMSPGDFCLRDGHEGQGFGISLKLLHLHHLQQDADHWRSLWHEGQSGVLPPPFRDSHPGGVPGAFQSLGCSRWEGPGFGSGLCQHFGTALLQWRGDCSEGETQEKKKPGAWSRSSSLQCR